MDNIWQLGVDAYMQAGFLGKNCTVDFMLSGSGVSACPLKQCLNIALFKVNRFSVPYLLSLTLTCKKILFSVKICLSVFFSRKSYKKL
jgi:hypothetical protein